MVRLRPCPECGSEQLKFMACISSVKCKKCGCKNGPISFYINKGYSEKEAAYRSWNDMCIRKEVGDNGSKEKGADGGTAGEGTAGG